MTGWHPVACFIVSVIGVFGRRLVMKVLIIACLFFLALFSSTTNAADLLVSSEYTNQVLRYDGSTGAFLGCLLLVEG